MPKIAEAFVEISARTDKLKKGLSRAVAATRRSVDRMVAIVKRLSLAFVALAGVVAVKSVKAFAEQEQAELKLIGTLRAHGDEIENNMAFLKQHASAIQSVTGVGDEELLTLFAQIRAFKVQAKSIPLVAKAAIGIASAFGLANESAAKYVALASEGETTMLRKYIPALKDATDKTDAFNIVLDTGAKGWQAYQESAKGVSGSFDILRAGIGDVFEGIGAVLVGSGGLTEMFASIGRNLATFGTFLADNAVLIRETFASTWDVITLQLAIAIVKMEKMLIKFQGFIAGKIMTPLVNKVLKLGSILGLSNAQRAGLISVASGAYAATGSFPQRIEARTKEAEALEQSLETELDKALKPLSDLIFKLDEAFQPGKLPEPDRPDLRLPPTPSAQARIASATVQTAVGNLRIGTDQRKQLKVAEDTLDEQKKTRKGVERLARQTVSDNTTRV